MLPLLQFESHACNNVRFPYASNKSPETTRSTCVSMIPCLSYVESLLPLNSKALLSLTTPPTTNLCSCTEVQPNEKAHAISKLLWLQSLLFGKVICCNLTTLASLVVSATLQCLSLKIFQFFLDVEMTFSLKNKRHSKSRDCFLPVFPQDPTASF